jgi:heme exporter protein D
MDLGPHAIFIWLCYGVVAIVVLGLIGWLWFEGHRRERELALLEGQGAGRRGRTRHDGPQQAR